MLTFQIVTQASASLVGDVQARIVMGADHGSICKFTSAQEGPFEQIHSGFEEVLKRVKSAMNPPSHLSSDRRV